MEIAVFHLETDSSGCAARGEMNPGTTTRAHSENSRHIHTHSTAPYTSLPPSEGEYSCSLKHGHHCLSGKSTSVTTSLILTPNRNPKSRRLFQLKPKGKFHFPRRLDFFSASE